MERDEQRAPDFPALEQGRAAEPSALDALVRRVERPSRPSRAGAGPRFDALFERLERIRAPGSATTVPRGMAVAALIVALVAGFLGWNTLARPAPIEERMPVASSGPVAGAEAQGPGGSAPAPTGSGDGAGDGGQTVTVHVAGAVLEPGLVSLPASSRVADAVEAAGGLADGADLDRVNLAAQLADAARVYIPLAGQVVPGEITLGGSGSAGAPSQDSPLDLNSADEAALEELPGVGPATAAAIVEHREANGAFASVDALLEVRGIGDAKLDALRDLVTVG